MTMTTAAQKGRESEVMKTVNAAITRAMNRFGSQHGCPPMQWYLPGVYGLDRGDVIGFPGPERTATKEGLLIVQRWADLLGLHERADEMPGYRSWLGLAGTCRIEIWTRTTTEPGAA